MQKEKKENIGKEMPIETMEIQTKKKIKNENTNLRRKSCIINKETERDNKILSSGHR